MEPFWKRAMRRTVQLTLTAMLCTLLTVTTVHAADDIYIAGNPGLAPFEYYDSSEECYKGVLPALYTQLEKEMGVSFIYLPPFQSNRQLIQAKNRQVELVSAHLTWDSQDLAEEIPIYTYQDGEQSFAISVGFTDNLPSDQADYIRNRLSSLSPDDLFQLSVSQAPFVVQTYKGVWTAIGIALTVILLGTVWYLYRRSKRTKRAESRKHLGNWADYLATYQALSPAEIQRLCYVALFTSDLRSLSQKDIQVLQKRTCFLLLKYTGQRESAFRISDNVFAAILFCDHDELAIHRIEDIISVLNQISVPGRPSPTRFHAGIYAPKDATIGPELAFERARHGWILAEQKGLSLFLLDQKTLFLEQQKEYVRSVIPQALEKEQFRLYLQFISDAQTGNLCGVEAFSRWVEPRAGLLRPDFYLPLLDEAQVIDQLDMGIFEQACHLLQRWQNTELCDLWLTCNFSHQTLAQKHFVNWFFGIANRFHFPHQQFILEVSERIPTSTDRIIRQNLRACKKAGFRIALDDLGSGTTMLRDLGSATLDVLKLDQMFFQDMQTQRGSVVLANLIQAAHDLELKVVCEVGEGQIQQAKFTGCDYIQSTSISQVIPHSVAIEFYQKAQKQLAEVEAEPIS